MPVINWRYILFNWNDSDEEMALARRLAAEMRASIACAGRSPTTRKHAYSRRFAPGAEDHAAIRHEIWDDNDLGNAIPGATPRAQIEVRGAIAGRQLFARRARRPVRSRPASRNLSQRPFAATATYGRRLVRLGAQLAKADGTMREPRLRARVPAAHPVAGGDKADIAIDVPMPKEPGRYALKLRPGQRRHRLVRDVRLADDDPAARRALVTVPVTPYTQRSQSCRRA